MRSLKTTAPAARRGVQPAFLVTCSHLAPLVDDHTALLAEWPGSRPLYQPPMIHILSAKVSVIGKSLWIHGAFFSTSFQVLPSLELQTSRGGASNDWNQPPKIQS